jgi:hypothetical protein
VDGAIAKTSSHHGPRALARPLVPQYPVDGHESSLAGLARAFFGNLRKT